MKSIHFGKRNIDKSVVYREQFAVGHIIHGPEAYGVFVSQRLVRLPRELPLREFATLKEAREFARFAFATEATLAPLVGALINDYIINNEVLEGELF